MLLDLAALALEDRPAAHFFTLVNIKEDMPFISLNDTIGERGEGSYCLAAPQCSGQGQILRPIYLRLGFGRRVKNLDRESIGTGVL